MSQNYHMRHETIDIERRLSYERLFFNLNVSSRLSFYHPHVSASIRVCLFYVLLH